MGHWSDPKVYIPPYDAPPGTLFYIRNRHGLSTYEKQEDGSWPLVALDETRGTTYHLRVDNSGREG